MKTSLRMIFALAATMLIVGCGGGLTGQSTGSDDSSEDIDSFGYSRVAEGSCETDFANSEGTGVGEVVAPQIYFESLSQRVMASFDNETFSFRSSIGSIARNGPFATWTYEQAIKLAKQNAPERFDAIYLSNEWDNLEISWQEYENYQDRLCDVYEGRDTLRTFAITLDKLFGATDWSGHASKWDAFEYVETGPNVIPAPSPTGLEHYTKYITGGGVIIVGGPDVDDQALLAAREAVIYMTSARPKFREILKANQARISLFGPSGDSSVLPEYPDSNEPGGFAMGITDASMTANSGWGCYPGNPDFGGNPVIHEMVHTINHIVFEEINEVYFYERVYGLAKNAIDRGIFPAFEQHLASGEQQDITHRVGEYWAMVVEGYIMDREGFKDSHDTRDWILENDPEVYDLITRYFPTEPWSYCPEVENPTLASISADTAEVFVSKWGTEGTGNGEFTAPHGVVVASDGSVYVADLANHRIQKFTSAGVFVRKWGTQGTGDGEFIAPRGIAMASDGGVYVSDRGNNRIQKFNSDGVFVSKWGTQGTGDGEFRSPADVAVASDGSVYVSDTDNHRIQKFNSDGVFVSKWGIQGTGDGEFIAPHGVAVASDGSVYVSGWVNHRIQKFTSEGVFVSKWGSEGTGDGQFQRPHGIFVAPDGSVYVSEVRNHRIQKFTSAGVFADKWGTYGSGNGQFQNPYGVTVASDGSVYVSDTENHRIQKFSVGANGNTLTEPHGEDREDRATLPSPQITCPDGSETVMPSSDDLLFLRAVLAGNESEPRFFPPVIFGDDTTMLVFADSEVEAGTDPHYDRHGQIRVYDDGTHGDLLASDGLFSAACLTMSDLGVEYDQFGGLAGSYMSSGGSRLHVINPSLRGSIEHTDFGNGLTGTEHALFLSLGEPGYDKVRQGDYELMMPGTCEACAAVLEEFGDKFDHILLVPDEPINGPSYVRVSDDIQGILTYGDSRCGTGMWSGAWNDPADYNYEDVEFGCYGKFLNGNDYPRLKGIIWAPDPELGGLNHEFGHWMGFGPSSADFPGSGVSWNSEDRMHLDSNSTVESPMSGPFWDPQRGWPNEVRVLDGDMYKPAQIRSNGDGTFTMVPRSSDQEVFDDIILYMMGFLPVEQAQERYHFLVDADIHLNDCRSYPGFLDCNDATIDETEYGTMVEFGVNEMISQFGPRVPSYADAPKNLNAAAIVLTNDAASEAERAWYDLLYGWWSTENSYNENFGATWPFATRGLSTITTGIPSTDTTPVAPEVAVNNAPVAVDDIVYWADLIDNGYDIQNPQVITFAVTENDTDADGHALTIVSVTQGVNGSVETVPGFDGCPPPCGRVTYNPDGSFPPFDTFTYTISDGYGGTATGTVTVTNVPPVNNVPVAIDDATSVAKGETAVITVTSNDTDADGDTLTIGSVTQPTNGTAESTQGGVIYLHDGSNTTTDTFTYTVADGNGGTAAGTVTVTISENNNPLAVDDAWSVRNGWRAAYSVRDNDIDLDGDPLTVVETSGAGSGRSTIAHSGNFGMVGDQPGTGVSYTHDGSDTTTDTFTYTVSDGNGGTATASVTVTIVAANRRPAIVDETVIVANGERVEIDILSNDSDADGDTLRVRSVTQGANGEVEPSTGADAWLPSSENGTKLAYTHDGSATTSDTVTYTVSDGFGGIATGTVTVTISAAVNNVPVAVDDAGDAANAGTVEISVLANDSDADGNALTIDSVTQGNNGTAAITSGGVTYTHDGSATTSDTFTYTVSDGNGGTDTGTVTITIAE